MTLEQREGSELFSEWHPHFTPASLSNRLVSHLPLPMLGAVVDPACGAGNLLAAAALRSKEFQPRGPLPKFVGIDVSARAVLECEAKLANLLPKGNFNIFKSDFINTSACIPMPADVTFLMNPPFRGYGELSKITRRSVAAHLEMKGRFNLGYAFVRKSILKFKPKQLVALLPSNWIHSRSSAFRAELDSMGGSWNWEDVGSNEFRDVDVDVGILVWSARSNATKTRVNGSEAKRKVRNAEVLEVKHGVATGSDDVFIQLGSMRLGLGHTMSAVRGRDVGGESASVIWIPPETMEAKLLQKFESKIGGESRKKLRNRYCVRVGGRKLFEYHEAIPKWFCGSPKVLIPEIVTRTVRVELDEMGEKLPLHSVLAIKVPSAATGRKLVKYFRSDCVQAALLSRGPRLAGGAIRLQVESVRDILDKWKR